MKKVLLGCLVFLFFGTAFAFSQIWESRYELSESNLNFHDWVSYVNVENYGTNVYIDFICTDGMMVQFIFRMDDYSRNWIPVSGTVPICRGQMNIYDSLGNMQVNSGMIYYCMMEIPASIPSRRQIYVEMYRNASDLRGRVKSGTYLYFRLIR
jgi:hypothetical protein